MAKKNNASDKNLITSGYRKRAVAKAVISKGTGRVLINDVPVSNYPHWLTQLKIKEPLLLAEDAAKNVDIHVTVKGGGVSGQGEAARLAIAKAFVEYTKDDALKKAYQDYDKTLLVADVRRKEPKKPNTMGHARSKITTSFR